MNKLLLFMGLLALPFTQKTVAQFTSLASVPTDVALGSTTTFNITYTSSVESKVAVALFIFDVDGSGNLTPDWGTWKAGIVSDVVPAASNASYQLSLAVPGGIDPSSALPSGKTYVWSLTLTDAAGNWIAGTPYATTLVTPSGTVNSVQFEGTAVTEVNAGATAAVGYSYSLVENGIVKVALSKYNDQELWMNDVATYILDPAIATSTPTEASANLTVPSDVVPSAQLTNGETYKWEVSIFSAGWASYLGGVKSNVTVNGLAGVAANVKGFAVYPNPATTTLFLHGTEVQRVQVLDLTGKTLISTGAANSIDVSALAAGVYFVKVNNTNPLKFIKQ
jgi:Secretion system C-terminal sorting domain